MIRELNNIDYLGKEGYRKKNPRFVVCGKNVMIKGKKN